MGHVTVQNSRPPIHLKAEKAFQESQQSPNPSSPPKDSTMEWDHDHNTRIGSVGQSIELVMKFSTMFSFMHAFRFCHFFQHVHVHLITTLKSTKNVSIQCYLFIYYYYYSIGKKWCPNSNFCNPRSYFQATCFRLLPLAQISTDRLTRLQLWLTLEGPLCHDYSLHSTKNGSMGE